MKKNVLNIDIIKIIAPLLNFRKERSDALEIGNDFIIREATDNEINSVQGIYKSIYLIGKFEVDYPNKKFCVIESQFQLNKSDKYYPMDPMEWSRVSEGDWLRMMEENQKILSKCKMNIEEKLIFLRLQKRGLIGSNIFIIKERNSMLPMTVNYYILWRHPNYLTLYDILDTDIDKYVKDYQLFGKKISIEEPMFRYFFKSYHEPLIEDRLVDLVISLESLYLAEEKEKMLFRYKLAMRCAAYIKEQYCDRKKVFKMVKEAYDLRSKIVHGSKKERNKINKESIKMHAEIEDYLRVSLTKRLMEGKDLMANDFDNLLLY